MLVDIVEVRQGWILSECAVGKSQRVNKSVIEHYFSDKILHVAQSDLKHMILWSQSLECWYYRNTVSYSVCKY